MTNDFAKVRKLLSHRDPEVRCAAVMVLGRLRPVADAVVRALIRRLEAETREVKPYVMDALAATKDKSVLKAILPYLDAQGSLGEAAVRVVRRFGKTALDPILRIHGKSKGWLGGGVVKAIAAIADRRAVDLIFDRLPLADWEQARSVSLFLRENVGRYPEAVRERVHQRIVTLLEDSVVDGNPNAVTTCLKLVVELRVPIDVRKIVPFLEPRHQPSLRRHALQVIAEMTPTEDASSSIRSTLLELVRDPHHDDVAGPALDALLVWKGPRLEIDEIRHITVSRHPDVIEFGLRELIATAPEAAFDEILRLLEKKRNSPGRAAALAVLPEVEGGVGTLVRLYESANDPEVRDDIAHYIVDVRDRVSRDDVARLVKGFFDDSSAVSPEEEAMRVGFLGALGRDTFNELTQDWARARSAASEFQTIIDRVQPIVRHRQATEETRLVLALANLALAGEALTMEDPHFARCIGLLGPLARTDGYDLAWHLKRRRTLAPEQLDAVVGHLEGLGPREKQVALALRE